MGNLPVCPCKDEATIAEASKVNQSPPVPVRKKHRVTFESRPFGMTPAKDEDDKEGKSSVGYTVVDVNRTDPKRPAFRLGVRPGWSLTEVNATNVQGFSLQDIQSLLKEAPLPLEVGFELPLASQVFVTLAERPFGLKPLVLPEGAKDPKDPAARRPSRDQEAPDPGARRPSLNAESLTMTGYEVAFVNPDRPAAAQGVSVGWIVSKVGDQDVRFAPLGDVKKALEAAELPVSVQFDTPADQVVFE